MKTAAILIALTLAAGAGVYVLYGHFAGAPMRDVALGDGAPPDALLPRYAARGGVGLKPAPYRNLLPRPAAAPLQPPRPAGEAVAAREPRSAPARPARPLRYEQETSRRGREEEAAAPPSNDGEPVRYRRAIPESAGTLDADGARIALAGVEALAPDAQCETQGGESWPCGHAGTFALRRFIRGRSIVCETVEPAGESAPRARCEVGGRDIGLWVVRQGWAIPAGGGEDMKRALESARRDEKGQWRKEAPSID